MFFPRLGCFPDHLPMLPITRSLQIPDCHDQFRQTCKNMRFKWFLSVCQIGSFSRLVPHEVFRVFFARVLVSDIARLGVRQIRLIIVENARLAPKPDWE